MQNLDGLADTILGEHNGSFKYTETITPVNEGQAKVDFMLGITAGQHDAILSILQTLLTERQKVLGIVREAPQTQVRAADFYSLNVGDHVRFNNRARPRYLCGVEAQIVDKNRSKVVVHLLKDVGKYRTNQNVTTPCGIIDKVYPN